MPTVDILYSYFYDENGNKPSLGGVQTYILYLTKLCEKLGFSCRVFQFAQNGFERKLSDSVKIIGVPVQKSWKHSKKCSEVVKTALSARSSDRYLTIFASDTYITDKKIDNSIAIQHGIFWDLPLSKPVCPLKSLISKALFSYNTIKRISKVDKLICVDYNFINWYRTQRWSDGTRLIPIMNFSKIIPFVPREQNEKVRIVFARRFFKYRGTRVFAKAAKRLLEQYSDIEFTLAGSGPDEDFLRQELGGFDNVVFTRYEADDSLDFHKQFDIAVVPTTGSEGTSLSLLEAMSAGCAVVCTNVGGMTNIVLNGYNGLMVSAGDDVELYDAVKELIDDPIKRKCLAEKAYSTVSSAFSYECWENKWSKVLTDMLS